jgi:signal transduction histidine kinase/DNA-binding NarL/FixJ family response regulator
VTGEAGPGNGGPPARVLVVDDDERNLMALAEVLEPIAEVVCSVSGRDALRQLMRGEFAVILLDVFMPDLDGYDTAALIRERRQTSRIPIIFLSAVNKETEHLMRGYEMGAVDYVFKPVDALVLKSKVSVFVDLFNMRRQLEDSERRQATILRALPMAIYEAFDVEGAAARRQFVGGDLVHFFGDDVEAVLRGERDWQDRIHPDDRERLEREATHSGDTVTVEYRWMAPDGSKRHLLDQRVTTGSAAFPGRWAGTLLDITERKVLEAQLVHVGKLDALGRLTGGVAHDFNNLLAAIIGGINILQRRLEIGENEQPIVDHMRHAAEQGTELVRRMMSFARQQDLTPASVDPSILGDSVAGLVSHTLGGMVTVAWKCPERGLNLFVDRGQLELALMNLIINARDAMPEGGEIEVTVEEAETSTADRPMLAIRVADSGCGIPEDKLAQVTEPFFTTKETGKGTGLGLSMVSGFVHQSGGEIRIESVVGQGTTIDLILPATEAEPVPEATEPEASFAWLADKRLMLIDDDDAVRSVLSEQLGEVGGTIDQFASGREAIAAVRKSPRKYDFVLSDFAMPGLDGLETLRQIGELAPSVRSALMTGNADDARLNGSLPVPVIRKPIDLNAVTNAFCRPASAAETRQNA